ncbi:hypothetical protein C8Q79DRAFT_949215 [Trametes meyenii]|nr:hypothetical protein C8Q79DRAFT_949215 [Trametes meyenii]
MQITECYDTPPNIRSSSRFKFAVAYSPFECTIDTPMRYQRSSRRMHIERCVVVRSWWSTMCTTGQIGTWKTRKLESIGSHMLRATRPRPRPHAYFAQGTFTRSADTFQRGPWGPGLIPSPALGPSKTASQRDRRNPCLSSDRAYGQAIEQRHQKKHLGEAAQGVTSTFNASASSGEKTSATPGATDSACKSSAKTRLPHVHCARGCGRAVHRGLRGRARAALGTIVHLKGGGHAIHADRAGTSDAKRRGVGVRGAGGVCATTRAATNLRAFS